MSRSVPWRRAMSDACSWHQSQALESTLYILRQTGPTGFLLKEEEETKNVKVFLGDPHTCTCPVFQKERDLCKHICWILLKKFRLSLNDPLSWQLGLVEREINEILRGKVTSEQPRSRPTKAISKASEMSEGRAVVDQREIADGDVCPICQDEMLVKKLPVTYCKFGCGNSIHIKCMQVWAEHQLKSSSDGTIKCPMCREDFGPIDLLKTEMKNAGCTKTSAPGIRMDRHVGMTCAHCNIAPIEGKCYRCSVCPNYLMCQKCFNLPVHTNHSFHFRHKRNQRWRPAPRTLGSSLPPALVNDLMHRDLSENDYDVLLQLERNSEGRELSNLTEEAVQAIPLEKVREGGPLLALGSQCRVCLRGFSAGQFVRKLPCQHKLTPTLCPTQFHRECIDSWLLHSHPTCPVDGLPALSAPSTRSQARQFIQEEAPVTSSDPQDMGLAAYGIAVSAQRPVSDRVTTRRVTTREQHQPTGARLDADVTHLDSQGQRVTLMPELRPHNALQEKRKVPLRGLGRGSRSPTDPFSRSPTDQFLTPRSLIHILQTSSALSTPAHDMTSDTRRFSAGSLTSTVSDLGRSDRGQGRRAPLGRRQLSLERVAPSIRDLRREYMDLFLGHNPLTHPPVSETHPPVRETHPPVCQDQMRAALPPRPRLFKPSTLRRLPPLARQPAKSAIRLVGSRLEDSRLECSRLEDSRLEDSRLKDSRLEDSRLEDSRLQDSRLQHPGSLVADTSKPHSEPVTANDCEIETHHQVDTTV
ncbi:uncharacterized protein LOC131932456 isoform X2 [Physella acuta]|uniref:uncharacterized protein LOC131932456 isoform X2 n=1 Tax=Physella acuta TaxID=109671 RepID=UPI0027DADAEF|nr:uncharacterized protein LOC131932456 isoform X2 [Physella acuta]